MHDWKSLSHVRVDLLEGHLMSEHGHGGGPQRLDHRPYPYVYKRSTKVQHRFCDRISERQECDFNPSQSAKRETSIWTIFLGQGVLCQHVGLDEATIRKYIRDQEKLDQQQLELDLE